MTMRMYDFRCDTCGELWEDVWVDDGAVADFQETHDECGGFFIRDYSYSCRNYRPFKKFTSHNISSEGPVEIDSYATLKREMKKNNMDYLETPMGEPGCEV